MVSSGKRLERWDNIKFVLIFLVVLGHICDSFTADSAAMRCIFIFIYMIHMPLFLFVSGLFSKKYIDEARYSKIFSYLVLYIVIKILLSLSSAAVNRQVSFSLFYESGVPWYALALFVFCLVTIALRKFSRKFILIFAILLACFAGYDNSIADFLALSRLIVFYPFFYLGYCLKTSTLENLFSKKVLKILSAIIIVSWIIFLICRIDDIYWIRPMLTGKNPYSALEKYSVYGGVIRLLYYFAVGILGTAFIAVIPKKINIKIVSGIGKRTLQIYALHHVIITLVFGLTAWQTEVTELAWPFAVLAVFFMAAAITGICSLKFLEPPFKLIMNIPKTESGRKDRGI